MEWLLVVGLASPALVFIGYYAWALWGPQDKGACE